MPKSMTAFAGADAASATGSLRIELRAVNHRFLETAIKLPEELRSMEPAIREALNSALSRGKVDVYIRYKTVPGAASAPKLNATLAQAMLHIAQSIQTLDPKLAPARVADVMAWPGVIEQPDSDQAALLEQALDCFKRALKEFNLARTREGDKLAALMLERVDQLEQCRVQARELAPQLRVQMREKLLARLQDVGINADPTRYEQEVALLMQKADVEEEMDRLGVHLQEARRVMALKEPIGRRLDFLVQEMHREANTFGAKSVDARASQLGVDMKVLIEQIREQVQNLE
jgi:uncharacterized protein (TIGR00255 family)